MRNRSKRDTGFDSRTVQSRSGKYTLHLGSDGKVGG